MHTTRLLPPPKVLTFTSEIKEEEILLFVMTDCVLQYVKYVNTGVNGVFDCLSVQWRSIFPNFTIITIATIFIVVID